MKTLNTLLFLFIFPTAVFASNDICVAKNHGRITAGELLTYSSYLVTCPDQSVQKTDELLTLFTIIPVTYRPNKKNNQNLLKLMNNKSYEEVSQIGENNLARTIPPLRVFAKTSSNYQPASYCSVNLHRPRYIGLEKDKLIYNFRIICNDGAKNYQSVKETYKAFTRNEVENFMNENGYSLKMQIDTEFIYEKLLN